jgi:sugar phosphate isomerase/epimerase
MPKLAAFPKAFMNALCKDGSMKLSGWIEMAVKLDVEGLEWYAGFLEMEERSSWQKFREQVEEHGKEIPMLCCSPDFTHPDPQFRSQQIEQQKYWIDMINELGGSYCRVLSGQKRPEIGIDEGIDLTVSSIEECLPYAEERGITLIIENHYKDDFLGVSRICTENGHFLSGGGTDKSSQFWGEL